MKIRTKKFAFCLILSAITVLGCEMGARLIFAFLVGPKVLLYGTGAYRTEVKTFPSVVMEKVGYTPPTPGNYKFWGPRSTYTKFSPNEVKTDKDENGNRFHPTINSRGFRGNEFSDQKKPGVIRIVTLGASSTFGYHNRDNETYPYLMEMLLNAASNGKKTFEVINLGIPHMGSEQILSILVNEALPLTPDVVTFYEGYNDTALGPDVLRKKQGLHGEPHISDLYSDLTDYSLVAALVTSLSYYAGERDLTQADLQHHSEKQSLTFIANVSAMNEVCRRNKILFILANQQSRSQIMGREQVKGVTFQEEEQMVRNKVRDEGRLSRREAAFLVHSSMMKSVGRWAAANDLPFVDVIRALDDDRSVLLTYVHANERGNRIIAEELAKEIFRRVNRVG